MHLTFELTSSAADVRETLGLVRGDLMRLGVNQEHWDTAEIVLAEVLNNVVEHGYAEEGGGAITLNLEITPQALHVQVRDQGRAFPGLTLPDARSHDLTALDVDALPEGGFGWALIHHLTQDLAYVRKAGENRLSFAIATPD